MSLPKICTCPTVPAADCPFHHQDACGSLAARPCSLCGGKGHYMYDHNHGKPCERCCKHTDGWWELTEHHAGYIAGTDNGCCRAGCGQLRRELHQANAEGMARELAAQKPESPPQTERSNSADRKGGEKAMNTEPTTPAPKVGSSALFSELVSKAAKMTRPEVQAAIDACHPCTLETDESYAADALAMELIHARHDKREIVNMIRWALMGCPSENADGDGRREPAPPCQ